MGFELQCTVRLDGHSRLVSAQQRRRGDRNLRVEQLGYRRYCPAQPHWRRDVYSKRHGTAVDAKVPTAGSEASTTGGMIHHTVGDMLAMADPETPEIDINIYLPYRRHRRRRRRKHATRFL